MEAVPMLQQAARDYSPGYSEHVELLLALAHHRLGHVEEARRWLQKTDKGIERFAREALWIVPPATVLTAPASIRDPSRKTPTGLLDDRLHHGRLEIQIDY